ncbi:hypothetical protein N665_0596s0028 [Sinapis alba]|nr:hypothetical protein N665_0596s0028 [Sinapis alba]
MLAIDFISLRSEDLSVLNLLRINQSVWFLCASYSLIFSSWLFQLIFAGDYRKFRFR